MQTKHQAKYQTIFKAPLGKALALFLAALFITLTPLVQAQTKPEIIDYKLKVGDVLTYEIIQHSKKQIMKIKLTTVPNAHFDFAKLTFDWTKTGENINQSGKVQFTGNTIDDYNLSVTSSFRIDFDQIQGNKIFPSQALWLGAKAQMQIVLSGSEFSIALLDDKKEIKYTLENKVYYPTTTFNGKPCHIVTAKYKQVSNTDNVMIINEGDANPLIMAVFIEEKDFLLQLISIEEGKLNTEAANPAVSAQRVNATPSIPRVKPDSDRDGITDDLDKCINEREDMDGFEDSDGCPDKDNDNDGIEDMYDKCPNTKGTKSNGGCP